MAKTIEETLKKQREQQRRQQERQRAKAIAKAKDPEHQKKLREKKLAQADKARAKQIAKMASPEYKAEQIAKANAAKARQMEKAKQKPPAATKPKAKKSSKGLKGRTPTAEEKRIMDALAALPCIACYNQRRHTPIVSYHHIDGRTKPYAHARGLPLCAHHHDTPADKALVEKYPDLVPIHAKGSLGGKTQWRSHHGRESNLLIQCYAMAGIDMPHEVAISL